MRLVLALLLALTAAVRLVPPAAAAEGAFAFGFTTIEEEALPLAKFAGQPILVVNTASQCGFTYQYTALQRLWDRYRQRGLVVVGVPSNDFNQERGDNEAIKTFCETNFAIDFPLAQKVAVTGPDSHPLFAWLRHELGEAAGPRWNFTKYLIGPDGKPVAFWPSTVEPDAPAVTSAIERLLPAGS